MSKQLIPTDLKEIPLEQIRAELPQPRKELGVDKEEARILLSLKEDGLLKAVVVTQIGKDEYRILDGHRRFKCAQILGWKTIRCEVYPEIEDEGLLEKMRFNLQNNLKPWKPTERSEEVQRIKEKNQIKGNRELSLFLHYPETLVSASLTLQKKKEKYQQLMDEFGLSYAYQSEFVKLYPKIRDIREFTVDDIVRNIFTRVRHTVIRSAKDFRQLSSVFLRAHTNEEDLYQFLKDPDMKVDQLYERTDRSGYIRDLENVLRQTAAKENKDINFSEEEDAILEEFFNLIKDRFLKKN